MSDINAASCTATDVQTAINTAITGDRVLLPTCIENWTSGVTVSGKNITLLGNGVANTVITTSGAASYWLNIGTTATRVTALHLKWSTGSALIRADGQNFRVDSNKLEYTGTTGFKDGVYCAGTYSSTPHPTGVIDNNTFINCRVLVYGDLNLLAHTIWNEATKLSAADQTGVVYVETNTFSMTIGGNCIDSNYGARYVFRYNNCTRCPVDNHSVQGNARASRSYEIYNNTMAAVVAQGTGMFIRGGTGVIYSNTLTGPWTQSVKLDNVRSFDTRFIPPQTTPPGGCAGLPDGDSDWDGNTASEEGWPCRDQIGRGADSSLWTDTTRPYSPAPPSQASEPLYLWSNTLNAVATHPLVVNCSSDVKPNGSCADIVIDRDYFSSVATAKPGYSAFGYPYCSGTNGPGCGLGAGEASLSGNGSFADTIVGSNTDSVYTLSNIGGSSFTINSITEDSGEYSISSNGCGASLAASANCTFTVRFTPTGTGLKTGTLTVDTSVNDPTSALSGTGVTAISPGNVVGIFAIKS